MFPILPLVVGLLSISTAALADIRFEEVSAEAGILHSGASQGASWGDLNGDGWPDVWVGNHYEPPSLYLNQQDGTFVDVIASVWSADPQADKHGAEWADFDNDGDQDLLVSVGAVMGRGSGAKYLFVNHNGILQDEAQRWGLDYPLGRGRTPLWFDADRDGRLDVVLMTAPRPDGKAPSAVFRQTSNGFAPWYSLQSQFPRSQPSRLEKIGHLLRNLVHLDFRVPTWIQAVEFAQLADVSGDGLLDLVVFTNPVRLYSLTAVPFDDFTHRIGFPADPAEPRKADCWLCSLRLSNQLPGVWDAAIEDFDGDGHFDMYLARPRRPDSEVLQTTPFEIRGTFAESSDKGEAKTLHFRTSSNVTFQLNVPWEGPSNPFRTPLEVAIGSSRKHTATEPFTLTPDDPSVSGPVPAQATTPSEVSIVYDPASSVWMFSSAGRRINFILRAAATMEQVRSTGFKPNDNQGADLLLVRRGERFVTRMLPRPTDQAACHSVAAGDFDNDMDVDIYLVCTGQIGNLPNRLLENDGNGNFREVPGAGGAAGSKLGRGDVVAIADYDRDGFLDVFITNGFGPSPFADEGPHQLFRNQGNGNHWLEIDLEGTVSNRDGIGASVILEAGGVVQIRGQGGGMHRDSQHHQRIHFGLAQHAVAGRLTVRWPSGIQQQLEKVQADQILRIKERP